ncbi:hypothetical protein MTO96_015923 [Rhipicephalus appendiculatus]
MGFTRRRPQIGSARSSRKTPTRTRGPPSDDGARTRSGRRQAGAEIPAAVGAIAPHESRPGVEEATGASFFSLGALRWWWRGGREDPSSGALLYETTGQSAANRSRVDVVRARTTKSL